MNMITKVKMAFKTGARDGVFETGVQKSARFFNPLGRKFCEEG